MSCNCSSTTSCTCNTQPFNSTSTISWYNVRYVPFSTDDVPRTVRIEVTSAQILDLFSTPLQLIAALGSGKVINILSAYSVFTQGGANYTNANPLTLRYIGETNAVFTIPATHITTTGKNAKFTPSAATDDNFSSDAGVELFVPVANPTVGTGTMVVYITYNILTLS
jgi:hypothetical protein